MTIRIRGKHLAGGKEGWDAKKRATGIMAMIDQDEVWIDREGNTHNISTMDPRHAENVVRFLLRRATGLATQYGIGQAIQADQWALTFGEPDDFDIPLPEDEWEEQAQNPEGWLIQKPLLQALRKRANQWENA